MNKLKREGEAFGPNPVLGAGYLFSERNYLGSVGYFESTRSSHAAFGVLPFK